MYLYRFLDELNAKIQKDHRENSTLSKITKTPRQDKDDRNDKNQKGKNKKQLGDRKEEEKMEKTKGQQPLKLSKTIRNSTETLITTKQSKTIGAKVTDNTTSVSVGIKSRTGKATGAKLIKEPDISKTICSSESTGTGTGLKGNNTVAAKPKHGKAVSPEPRLEFLKITNNTKDTDSIDLCSSYSDTAMPSETEKNLMDIWGSSKMEPSQGFWKSWSNLNTNIPQSSSTGHPNVSSSSQASLESTVEQTGISLPLQACQQSSNDHVEVATITSVTKPCNTITTLEHQSIITIPKALKVSDNEDREDLVLCLSIGATTTSLVNQTLKIFRSSSNEQKNNSETESDGYHSKSFISEPQENLGSFSNHTKTTATVTLKSQKRTFHMEARKKSGNPGRNDTTNILSISDLTSVPSTVTPDQRALTRSFVVHNMDTAALNECAQRSYPPPPPSSTPVLLPLASTPLMPPSSVVSINSPPISNHLNLGLGFHPVNHNHRY